jgi:hypothetical protein
MSKKDSQSKTGHEHRLSPREESYLKASKEIAVKYIETGRISVAAFDDAFKRIFRTVKETIEGIETEKPE